jgi:predicted metal-dependent hydrolase
VTNTVVAVERDYVSDAGYTVSYRLKRSARRTLEIAVDADGEVEVRAPRDLPLSKVRSHVARRITWIRSRLREQELTRPKLVPRTYTSGETHRYLGRQYRLRVEAGSPTRVALRAGCMHVRVSDPAKVDAVRNAVDAWYARRAREVFTERLERMLRLPGMTEMRPSSLRIQRMRMRWGSCTSTRGVILNSDLVKIASPLIDYVLAHELCHLRERSHGARFRRILARVIPDWLTRHQRLVDQRLD